MKRPEWQLRWEGSTLFLLTPLFIFIWYEYGKLWRNDLYVRGFQFGWKRNRIAKEGDLLFLKEFRCFTESVSSLEQHLSY